MAEETLILKLQLQADASKNAKTIAELTKQNKGLKKIIADAPKEGTEEYKKFEKQLDAAKKQYAQNKAEITKFNKELRTGVKQVEATESSLKGLSKRLKDAETQYKLLSKEQRKAADGRALQRTIKQTRAELLKAEKGLGDYRRQVGNYTRSLVGLNSGIGTIAVSVGQLGGTLRGLPALFRAASAGAKALILSLGPIAILIAAITAALSRFQPVIDRVSQVLDGLGAAVDVITERVGRLAKVVAAYQTGGTLAALDTVKDAFSGIGEEIINDTNAAIELKAALQELRRNEANDLVRLAEIERDVADARRKSAELEQTDRAAAADELQKAIDLIEERGRIELRNATERARVLREQVGLSAETTRIEDIEKLREAEANLIRVQAGVDNSVRRLITKRDQLRKERKKTNEVELSQLDQLLKRQSELTKQLKNQIATGEDYSSTLMELKTVTEEVNRVNAEFEKLTKESTESITFQDGSVAAYNETLSKLTKELEETNTESERYKELQKEIAQTEAQRSAAIGEITEALEALNEQQEEQIKQIQEGGTALIIQQQAQEAIEALTGTAEEVAAKRLAIEKQLEQDLRDVRKFSLESQLSDIDTSLSEIDTQLQNDLALYADNELKKTELLAQAEVERNELRKRQIDVEKELLDNSKESFDASEKEKTESLNKELEQREQLRQLAEDTITEAARSVTELFKTIQENQTEDQLSQIDKREDAAIREAELLNKTEAEKQAIRDKFEKEREAIERKAAAERKAIALAEATIDIAGAVIKSLNTPPPLNAALAASTAALGAVQLAVIAATNFANGGLVQPVALGDGRIVAASNIPQMANGDSVLATVRPNEVILNERQQAALGGPSTFASIGVPGFAGGGLVPSLSKMPIAKEFANGGRAPSFSSNIARVQAFANGGVAAIQSAASIESTLKQSQDEFIADISQAIYQSNFLGSKQGVESADIQNQIARQNERQARRTANESV